MHLYRDSVFYVRAWLRRRLRRVQYMLLLCLCMNKCMSIYTNIDVYHIYVYGIYINVHDTAIPIIEVSAWYVCISI